MGPAVTLVLVTGGAGFIGSRVVAALLAAGHQVRVLDRVRPRSDAFVGTSSDTPPDLQLHQGDVRVRADCDMALRDVSVVFHQAAKVGLGVDVQDLPGYAEENVAGTATLLAAMAAAEVPQLVLASSMVVYGEGAYHCRAHGEAPTPPPRAPADLDAGRFDPRCPTCGQALVPGLVQEDAPMDPRNAYAASKVGQEHFAAAWARATGGTATALRYHNVYGPGLPRDTPYAGVAALFCSWLAKGEPPRVFEDGRQRRDFVHVDDVAGANVAALQAPAGPGRLRAYNVGSGTPRSIGAMAEALAEAVDGPEPRVTGQYRLGDVRHITASSRRAADELGWAARVTFDAGMRELAEVLVRD